MKMKTTLNGPLTTATAIAPIDAWQAAILIEAQPLDVQRAARLLGLNPFDFHVRDNGSTSFKVGLAAPVATTTPALAQAAAEAIARGVAHIIAALEA